MFIELLYEMSKVLNYKFDKVYLKKSVYYPRGLSELELDQQTLRRAAVSFFSGLHPVNMNVTSFPSPEENPEVLEFQTKRRSFMAGLMEGKNKIPVSMETKNFNENF